MNTDIVKVETALTEFAKIEAGLADLRAQYAGVVFSVTTKEGMADALAARAAVRKPRYSTEEIRKAAKAPILELGRSLDAKAKYINAELLKIEDPIQAQIAVEESRKEQEKIVETQRKAQISQAIYDLHMVVSTMAGKSAAEIDKRILALQEYDLSEWAEEFIVDAEKARASALTALQQLHAGALAHEQAQAAEAAKAAQERAELETLRAEMAIHKAAEAKAAEAKRAEAEAEKARERIRAEEMEKAQREAGRLAREQAAKLVDEQAARAVELRLSADGRLAEEARAKEQPTPKAAAEPRPTRIQIIRSVGTAFGVDDRIALAWIVEAFAK